ncbi:Ribose-5-phosphate isomerase A [Frankliniella fusca]|uniref:Ribose-5-phosphate isomerase A n=1 Tax=Frankliniella fusca TaxID=407009 RepID=A0AAE1I223_9NEOP|nr:Ribose-5-phosphate isomerase A [Frankliniella fusca]
MIFSLIFQTPALLTPRQQPAPTPTTPMSAREKVLRSWAVPNTPAAPSMVLSMESMENYVTDKKVHLLNVQELKKFLQGKTKGVSKLRKEALIEKVYEVFAKT